MTDRLAMNAEAMRMSGYAAVDRLVELVDRVGDLPAYTGTTPAEMRARVSGTAPENPTDIHAVLERLTRDVLPFISRTDHPRYFAFIPTSGTWPGALGDFIASALSICGDAWLSSAGPSHLEREVVRWFAEWLGFPAEAGGVLVSGGSAANLTALACAREARVGAMRPDLIAYVSDQSHSSVARAARVLGFTPEQVRILPVDERFRFRPDVLAAAVAADRAAGLEPLLVSAAAGSTNTGAVDPLHEIADVCEETGLWLHVDGAYGAFATLTDRGRAELAGIERADSVTLDPHKWLYQSFECGCLLVRDGRLLRHAFAIEPDYLHDTVGPEEEINFSDYGMQLSRSARSLKVWMSVQTFGLDAFRATIDGCLDLAAQAEEAVRAHPELELLTPASLGIVCFRRHPAGVDDEDQLDAINTQLIAGYLTSGAGQVSSTRLRGRYAVRLCVLNHTSTAADVASTLEWFATTPVPGDTLDRTPDAHRRARDPDVGAVWHRTSPAVETLAAVPLFADLEPRQLEMLASVTRILDVQPGQAVVRRLESSRDFYLILTGEFDVFGEGDRRLRRMRDGEFFGELAALDWGAGYGYPRLATVVATTPARIVAIPATALHDLMRSAPGVAGRIRRTAQERAAII